MKTIGFTVKDKKKEGGKKVYYLEPKVKNAKISWEIIDELTPKWLQDNRRRQVENHPY